MKKQKKTAKKLSLDKLQVAKITTGLNSIKGGGTFNTGGGNDTGDDKTDPDYTIAPDEPIQR